MHEYKQKAKSNYQNKWNNNRKFPNHIQISAHNTANMHYFIPFFFTFTSIINQQTITALFSCRKKYRAIKLNNFRYNFLEANWDYLFGLFNLFDFWDSKTENIIRS